MPATEQTWRPMPVMHRVFAVACVVMFLATLWMFYDDHFNRGWKSYQMTARQIDEKMTVMRKEQFETDSKLRQRDVAAQAHAAALSSPVDDSLLQEFQKIAADNTALEKTDAPDLAAVEAANEELKKLSQVAAEKRKEFDDAQKAAGAAATAYHSGKSKSKNPTTAEQANDNKLKAAWDAALVKARDAEAALTAAETAGAVQREKVMAPLREAAKHARFVEDTRLSTRKFKSAALDEAKANESLAIGHTDEEREELNRKIDRLARQINAKQGLASPEEPSKVRELEAIKEKKTSQEIKVAQLQRRVNELSGEYETLNLSYQSASVYRKQLGAVIEKIDAEANATKKTLDDLLADLKRIEQTRKERRLTFGTWDTILGKRILTLPILDAFGSPLKIENLWSEGNEWNNNFRLVNRFDRCTTCHQAMEKSLPGEATKPAYIAEKEINFRLLLKSADTANADASAPNVTLVSTADPTPSKRLFDELGLIFAEEGLIAANDVTVSYVQPETPAASASPLDSASTPAMTAEELRVAAMVGKELPAQATSPGLMVGDVISRIEGSKIAGRAQAERMLSDAVREGGEIEVTVRRGLPGPYTSHPRLDLFVGSLSPHPMGTFGCTVCHEGQGSATEFRYASHTPDSTTQLQAWKDKFGWYDNHHWIFPMNSKRFSESSCLKCHHEVTELDVSEKYPDGAAPKVVQGHQLIQKHGCFGCHEVNGFDGPTKRIGPDLRLEPNYFAAALGMLPALKAQQKDVAEKVAEYSKNSGEEGAAALGAIQSQERALSEMVDLATLVAAEPENSAARQRLLALIDQAKESNVEGGAAAIFPASVTSLSGLLKDVEAAGQLRKVGPSLRFMNSKLDGKFVFDWLRDPRHFRPSTRMPRFFELWSHLDGAKVADGSEPAVQNEPVEILSIATYLAQKSQAFEFETPPKGITESTAEEKVERGKWQFQSRGCVACHSHKDFADAEALRPAGEILQGPDLSGVADKFNPTSNPVGKQWLYSWIKKPTKYHARTLMPDLQLDPIRTAELDEKGNEKPETVKLYDPVEDIVEFLLASSSTGYQPKGDSLTELNEKTLKALDQLTLDYLKEITDPATAKAYLKTGLPESRRAETKGGEIELITAEGQSLTPEQKLNYIGRKSIAKWGCYGCHDIPGFEDAKPIGTALADWGRKDPAKLAFEHIGNYLHGHGHGDAHASHGAAHEEAKPARDQKPAEAGHGEEANSASKTDALAVSLQDDQAEAADESAHRDLGHSAIPLPDAAKPAGELPDFYNLQLNSGNRIGFLFQKLREPRSYDYEKTENKKYGERLRMPQFNFNDEQREAVLTFVLGLVSEPPAAKYLYKPSPRAEAIARGRKLLDKYNCGGCHVLKGDEWDISFPPSHFEAMKDSFDPATTYPFQMPQASAAEIANSKKTDAAGNAHAVIQGLPVLGRESGRPTISDSEGDEIASGESYDPRTLAYDIQLLTRDVLGGIAVEPSANSTRLTGAMIDRHRSSDGGFLAKYLAPVVAERNRDLAKGKEAWGWVPPPLTNEGHKVQSDWLHDFLLEPFAIRPAVVLRMPKFNMSSDEATALSRYFAAVDNASYPNELVASRRPGYLESRDQDYRAKVAERDGNEPPAGARMVDSMKMVTKLCSQCHLINDFKPSGAAIAQAPNLAQVYKRLRPEYMRQWIANPPRILPYTGMPVNFPYDAASPTLGGMKDSPYHGASIEQVDAVVDLLMNYDAYNQLKNPVAGTFTVTPPAPAGAADATEPKN